MSHTGTSNATNGKANAHGGTSHPGTAKTTSASAQVHLTRFEPLEGGGAAALDLEAGETGALVLRITPQAKDEVICVWTSGARFAPERGTYWILRFKGPAWIKPSADEIQGFLDAKGIAGGAPGTINLHPPPTPST
jgi:hypothetical protein